MGRDGFWDVVPRTVKDGKNPRKIMEKQTRTHTHTYNLIYIYIYIKIYIFLAAKFTWLPKTSTIFLQFYRVLALCY